MARHGVLSAEVVQVPVVRRQESRLLTELAEAQGADLPAAVRAALRHYAAARSQRVSR